MLPRLVLRRAAPCARLPLVRRSFAAQAGDAGGKKEEKEEEDIHTQLVQLHREEQQRVGTQLPPQRLVRISRSTAMCCAVL